MARTETARITYDTSLCDGVAEYPEDGADEPFRIVINRVTHTDVKDGRGRNWGDSGSTREAIAELTLQQAIDLAKALTDDIGFAAMVGEDRVLKSAAAGETPAGQ